MDCVQKKRVGSCGKPLSAPGINANQPDQDEYTPLFIACEYGRVETVRAWLQHRYD